MWKDREDMKDPVAYIRKMRQSRSPGTTSSESSGLSAKFIQS